VETDGRHAVVAYATDVAEDAARRDFTMNALYCSAAGEVIDPLGGLPDLLAGRVRFVGDPAARIAEDHLRILRFFRFHAWYAADGIDAEGLAACAAGAEGIDRLSRERVGAEMRRLLEAPDPAPVVATMARAGVLMHVLRWADPAALPVLIHLEGLDDVPASWLRRLAVLGTGDATTALRLSRDEAGLLKSVQEGALGGLTHAALGFRLRHMAEDAALVRAALSGAPPPTGWRDEITRGKRHLAAPVTAADLMPALQGPALGARLAELTDRWLASDLRLTREDLLSGA
jgi:poly(A) polymerase